jgi:hypothetical protein
VLHSPGLLLIVPTTQAANHRYIFLYNGIERSLLRINGLNGVQDSFDLGLGQEVFLSGYDIAISRDGSQAACCATSSGGPTLVLRDLPPRTTC